MHTVLTDNASQFTFPPRHADGPTATRMTQMFDLRSRKNNIGHRLTKIKHPWMNGQVARMNRTVEKATVMRCDYDSHQQFEIHLHDFIADDGFSRRLKTRKSLTSYEFFCTRRTVAPSRYTLNRHIKCRDQPTRV